MTTTETTAQRRARETNERDKARLLARRNAASERESRRMITENGRDAYWALDVDAPNPGLHWGGAQDLACAARWYAGALDAAGGLDSLAAEIEPIAPQAAARIREITAQMFGAQERPA
jgi:hypothetical protein